MLDNIMYAGITERSWRNRLIRATQVGMGIALLSLVVGFALSFVFPDGIGPLAGDKLFRLGSKTKLFLVALVWAPCFETVVAQLLPITFILLFTKSNAVAIFGSALIFGVGHVSGGGSVIQGAIAGTIGLAFAYVFMANLDFGKFRATLLTAWVHCVHNAVVLLAAMSD